VFLQSLADRVAQPGNISVLFRLAVGEKVRRFSGNKFTRTGIGFPRSTIDNQERQLAVNPQSSIAGKSAPNAQVSAEPLVHRGDYAIEGSGDFSFGHRNTH
jgi:hypothetical protein